MSENHLDNLLRISIDGPSLNMWDASGAVCLWWKEKNRRVLSEIPMSASKPKHSTDIDDSDDNLGNELNLLSLDDWETL